MSIYLAVLVAGVLAYRGCSHTSEGRAYTADHAGSPGATGKLSPDLSRLYRESTGDRRIAVLVRTDAPLTREQKRTLTSQGIRVGTVSDSVFTADLYLKDVPLLAEKPYVRFIELSKKLNLLGR
ncbi:MAG: hypothetical protein M1517_07005 [Deltaproteobacteria bacterium]|nr:hypothetical protein [Deltaproteobacteria bacterium]